MTDEPLPPFPALPLEAAIAELLAALFAAPLEDDAVLARRLRSYLDKVRGLAHRHDDLDIGLVERIAQGLEGLLGALPGRDAADRRLVHAAARYFIHEKDAISDLASPIGFDDDAIVVGVVARHLGLAEVLPRGL